MVSEFFKGSLLLLLGFSLVGSILGLYHSNLFSLGISAGALWGGINLYFIKELCESYLINEKKNIFYLTGLKFPILYLFGYVLLNFFSPVALLIGFSLLFPALIIKGGMTWAY